MRTVFTIELQADIMSLDDKRRKAFVDVTVMHARQMYAQASMISKKPPHITVKAGGNDTPLFDSSEIATEE